MAMFFMSSMLIDESVSIDENFIIHSSELNKRYTTRDPRLGFTKDVSTKDSSETYSHQSNALQILYGTDLSNKTAIVTGANTGIGRYFI